MFEVDIEMLKEQGLQIMDTAKKTALDIADKGKNQLELLNQQARLSKAQRQLGALVYSLHKAAPGGQVHRGHCRDRKHHRGHQGPHDPC